SRAQRGCFAPRRRARVPSSPTVSAPPPWAPAGCPARRSRRGRAGAAACDPPWSVPSARGSLQARAFRSHRAGRFAAEQRRLMQLAERVRLVLAQGVLRPDGPLGIEARPRAGLDRLLEGVHRLVLEGKRLALQRRAVEVLLLGIEAA